MTSHAVSRLLALALFLLAAGAGAVSALAAMPPWTDRQDELSGPLARPEADERRRAAADEGLEGKWLCVPGQGRCALSLRGGRFEYDDAEGKARGRALRRGALLTLTPDGEEKGLTVFWQILGDGRLAINGGERILHREGRSPTPVAGEREFGSRDCRFTILVPADAAVEEIKDGVRIYTLERDAAVQVVSGTTDLTAKDFAGLMAMNMNAPRPREEQDGTWSFVTEARRGTPLYVRVAVENGGFVTLVITGDPSRVAWVARSLRVVRPGEPGAPTF